MDTVDDCAQLVLAQVLSQVTGLWSREACVRRSEQQLTCVRVMLCGHGSGVRCAAKFSRAECTQLWCGESRLGGVEVARVSVGRGSVEPVGYINTPLLLEQWDEILRFVTTMKLKETTASDLFRRLNSYSKQHSLYRALKTFGQILKSLFILRYLDDATLRQAVSTGESAAPLEVDSAPESKSDDEDGDEEGECDGDGSDEEDVHGDADNGSQPTAQQLAMIGRTFRLGRSHPAAAPAAERRVESRAAAACARRRLRRFRIAWPSRIDDAPTSESADA